MESDSRRLVAYDQQCSICPAVLSVHNFEYSNIFVYLTQAVGIGPVGYCSATVRLCDRSSCYAGLLDAILLSSAG